MHLRLNLRKEFHVSHGPNYLKKIKFKIHFPTTQKNRVYTYKMKKKNGTMRKYHFSFNNKLIYFMTGLDS